MADQFSATAVSTNWDSETRSHLGRGKAENQAVFSGRQVAKTGRLIVTLHDDVADCTAESCALGTAEDRKVHLFKYICTLGRGFYSSHFC